MSVSRGRLTASLRALAAAFVLLVLLVLTMTLTVLHDSVVAREALAAQLEEDVVVVINENVVSEWAAQSGVRQLKQAPEPLDLLEVNIEPLKDGEQWEAHEDMWREHLIVASSPAPSKQQPTKPRSRATPSPPPRQATPSQLRLRQHFLLHNAKAAALHRQARARNYLQNRKRLASLMRPPTVVRKVR